MTKAEDVRIEENGGEAANRVQRPVVWGRRQNAQKAGGRRGGVEPRDVILERSRRGARVERD